MNKKTAVRIVTIIVATAILAAAVYIMTHRLGLVEGADFGAGAYYYADIPADEYAKIDPEGAYSAKLPMWVHIVLFLGWGWLMYRLWDRIENGLKK